MLSRRQLTRTAQTSCLWTFWPIGVCSCCFPHASANVGLQPGSTLEGTDIGKGRLPAAPVHPAKGAGGPKASNFGTGQDAQLGAQLFMALALLYL